MSRNLKIATFVAALVWAWAAGACSNSDFSSGSPAAKKGKSKPKEEAEEPEVEEPQPQEDDTDQMDQEEEDDKDLDSASSTKDAPTDLIEQDGETSAPINYDTCKGLPSAGKRAYGKCAENEVVVIVNDGNAQEMTCCPLTGKNIFSKNTAELFVARTGLCQTDEVLTGMTNTTGSIICSKINAKYLTLGTPVPSQYVVGTAPGIMGEIAKVYNVSDTCICPEKTVAIGGHTSSDNKCGEQCVVIKKK